VLSAFRHFPEDFEPRRRPRVRRRHDPASRNPISGRPAPTSPRHGDAGHRRPRVERAGGHLGDARRGHEAGTPDPEALRDRHRWSRSARAGSAWSRSRAGTGTPASCTTPVADGHASYAPRPPRLDQLRKGVMELYISDHPLDCLTCAANGDCELQDMAGAVGLREVRYGYDGARSPRMPPKDEQQPLLHLRRRASASSARAACAPARRCRAPSRSPSTGAASTRKIAAGADDGLPRLRVRVLRRLRAGLPDRDAARKSRSSRSASPSTQVVDHLRLLRRRLLLQGRDAAATQVVRMVPYKDGEANRGPLLRQGPLRLGLRHPPGSRAPRR
jgi:hypothetical protein